MAGAGITFEIADARLNDYLAAERQVLSGQEYRYGDRMLTRADLGEIRAGIAFWNNQVASLNPATPQPRGRMRRGSYRGR